MDGVVMGRWLDQDKLGATSRRRSQSGWVFRADVRLRTHKERRAERESECARAMTVRVTS